MVVSEPSKVRRDVALVATTAVVASVLTAPAGAAADEGAEPPPTLRLAPERKAGVSAVDVPLRRRLEPTKRGRYATERMATSGFSMVGFTWASGEARVKVRVRSQGRWGAWRATERMPDIPDPSSAEGRRARSGTEPLWVRRSDGVQVKVAGTPPAGLEMALIEPGADPVSAREATGEDLAKRRRTLRPNMRSRKAWGANERWRSGSPRYNRTIQQVHVHHTVNGNGYSRSDVPGLIRGMYRYHTKNLGWSDIGYNFLVDKFGRTWVGRAGGPHRPVRGAHTLGFNSTSTGVSVIGNFQRKRQRKIVETAIVRLAAWKLHKHGRNPRGTVRVYSHGSDRFPKGRTVRLPVIDGHRDTNYTACPGRYLYDRLSRIRWRAADRIRRRTS
jgi:hypothetical protein